MLIIKYSTKFSGRDKIIIGIKTALPKPVPRMHKLATELEKLGHEIEWLVPKSRVNPYKWVISEILKPNPNEKKVDVIIGFGLDGISSLIFSKKPKIFDYPDPYYLEDIWPRNVLLNIFLQFWWILEGYLCRRVEKIVTTTNLQKDLLLKRHSLEEKDIAVVWNSVDPDNFKYKNSDLRELLGINGFTGIFLGQVVPSYGISKMIKDWTGDSLLILGKYTDVDYFEKVKKLSINYKKHVIFIETVPFEQVPEYLSVADIGVLPYPWTPINDIAAPNKLFEYMACELPVIASNLSQISEIIKEGENGFLYDQKLDISLSNAIKRAQEADLRKIGKINRESIEGIFDIKKQVKIYENILCYDI